jgi:hypothetical protein
MRAKRIYSGGIVLRQLPSSRNSSGSCELQTRLHTTQLQSPGARRLPPMGFLWVLFAGQLVPVAWYFVAYDRQPE